MQPNKYSIARVRQGVSGLAATLSVLSLAACGGGSTMPSADMPTALAPNGLPYATPEQAGVLDTGEKADVVLMDATHALGWSLGRGEMSVERVDATHLVVTLGGDDYTLEQSMDPKIYTATDGSGVALQIEPYANSLSHVVLSDFADGYLARGVVGYLSEVGDIPTADIALYHGDAFIRSVNEFGDLIAEEWDIDLQADFDTSLISALIDAADRFHRRHLRRRACRAG